MRVWTEAYGCTLNQGEALMLKELALQSGHAEALSPEEADVIILGSCIVIDQTERKMWKRLGEIKDKTVLISGCLPPVSEERLAKEIPNYMVVRPGRMEEAAQFFDAQVPELEPGMKGKAAILPIASGCEGGCTYCITRRARGELSSRPIDDIVGWAKKAIAKGAKELRLSAQDAGVYGRDIGSTLPELLNAITNLEGDFLIRIGMMNPSALADFANEMIAFYNDPKAYRFLHLPIQSGSDNVLKLMGRKYLAQEVEDLVKKMRNVQNLTLSTDIIVGFPGETEEDFQKTIELVKRIKPDIVNVTRFSPRPGTVAASLPDQVPGWKAKERSRQMTELRMEISLSLKQKMIGDTVDALVLETGRTGQVIARTRSYVPVVVDADLKIGSWTRLEITGAESIFVKGKPV